MFKKKFKIKSNHQLKASERKTFRDFVLASFSNLSEADFNDFLPKKEIVNVLKIITADDMLVHVYTAQKRPIVFETISRLFPSVYFLWKFPHILNSFTTHPNVMQYISSGADLMLPGVVTPPAQSGLLKYGNVAENERVYVNLTNNIAAIAVGTASESSAFMCQANGRGKCVVIRHFYGDHLCTLEGLPILPIVNLGPPEWLKLKTYEEDFPELGSNIKKSEDVAVSNETNLESTDLDDAATAETKKLDTTIELTDDMDEILLYCFIGAIKYSKVTLPVLTSNFFKLHMLPLCPESKTLDIKKSSYKKLKPFLEEMCDGGMITVEEVKKGVEQITAIYQDHPKFREFYISPENRPGKEEGASLPKTDVVQSYIITENVLPIFACHGYHKGSLVEGSHVRKCVSSFIRTNNMQDIRNARLVKPQGALARICETERAIRWEEVMEKVCESMRTCYKVGTGSDEIVNKGNLLPIIISVAVRSGNKKVTLVDNLELFGIRLPYFAKECQHGVAASTSISRPPGKKYDQLLVQGNQVLFIYELLTEKYKIPKKYVKGIEHAPKKKK